MAEQYSGWYSRARVRVRSRCGARKVLPSVEDTNWTTLRDKASFEAAVAGTLIQVEGYIALVS